MSAELHVRCVGKAYRRWRSEWLRAASWFGAPVKPLEEHWVLRDVTFTVGPGETVGIVGHNGAGKSTLLKLIVGTAQPTAGTVHRTGRVAAILELGMGFSPDMTGRQNVFHSAGLMGFSREQVAKAMPAIEAFAEIGEYFDEPVRTYSSGMQMRVAFSAATAFRPDLLIVDEALSVGDTYFVHKCFQRIREFRDAGTALLIVSHDASAIQSLCDRAILLESGSVVLDGPPQEVLDYYNARIAERERSTVRVERRNTQAVTESGTGEATFESLRLLDASRGEVEYVGVDDPLTLTARVRINAPVESLVFGYMIRDRLGQPVFGTNTSHTGQPVGALGPGDVVEFSATFDAAFGPGSYSISVALSSTETHLVNNYQWKDLALVFTVANLRHPKFIGVAHVPPRIALEVDRAGGQ